MIFEFLIFLLKFNLLRRIDNFIFSSISNLDIFNFIFYTQFWNVFIIITDLIHTDESVLDGTRSGTQKFDAQFWIISIFWMCCTFTNILFGTKHCICFLLLQLLCSQQLLPLVWEEEVPKRNNWVTVTWAVPNEHR